MLDDTYYDEVTEEDYSMEPEEELDFDSSNYIGSEEPKVSVC